MRRILISLVAIGSLAGCQTFDTKIRENLKPACDVLETAHATVVELQTTITIPQRYLDLIEAAYVPAHNICLHPESATTLQIVTNVIIAGKRIYDLLSQVSQSNPAAMRALQE